MMNAGVQKILFVTGLSGAGLSSALKALEDMGYEAIDNLPLDLVPQAVDSSRGQKPALALGVDCRTRGFSAEGLLQRLEECRQAQGTDARLLFLECDDGILHQRFTETRRRHPLAIDRPIADGVLLERQVLAGLKPRADIVIDTSRLNIHDLRRLLAGHCQLQGGHGLLVYVTSFAYRNGLPREADLVIDVRFLANPHYRPELRPLTGLDAAVAEFVSKDSAFAEFLARLTGFLDLLLPRYAAEGKSYLTIAVGCTGGRHRSVFVAEELFGWLDERKYSVGIRHRELEAAALASASAAADDGQEDGADAGEDSALEEQEGKREQEKQKERKRV